MGELGRLRTFLAVLDYGGLRRAAGRIYLSQPAVSSQIRELERLLGTPLFTRTAGGRMLPTTEALRFADRAQRLLDDYDDAIRAVRGEAYEGELTVGIMPGGIGELTMPLLRHLGRAFPQVTLRTWSIGLPDWPRTWPERIDLLMMRDPIADEEARLTTLLTEQMGLAVPERSVVAAAQCLRLDEALELPFVRMSEEVPSFLSDFWYCAEARRASRGDYRGDGVADPALVGLAIAAGVGVATATPMIARMFPGSAPTLLAFEGAPQVRVALVSRREDTRPVIDAIHGEAAALVRRVGPLVLPELAAAG